MKIMDKKDRPRTKRLERPTPNLKHPIICNKKSKEINSQLNECKTSANNGSDINHVNERMYRHMTINELLDEKPIKRSKIFQKKESVEKKTTKEDISLKNVKKVMSNEALDNENKSQSPRSPRCSTSQVFNTYFSNKINFMIIMINN